MESKKNIHNYVIRQLIHSSLFQLHICVMLDFQPNHNSLTDGADTRTQQSSIKSDIKKFLQNCETMLFFSPQSNLIVGENTGFFSPLKIMPTCNGFITVILKSIVEDLGMFLSLLSKIVNINGSKLYKLSSLESSVL